MDREILGIDHGNRQMKTANTTFLSTVTQNKVKPSNLNQILEFKGKYYSIGGSREDVDTKVDKQWTMITTFSHWHHLPLN